MKKAFLIVFSFLIAVMMAGCAAHSIYDELPDPIATITLSDGSSIRFELYVQDAPNTVANFTELANKGYYDGQSFFKIIPGALIQSGDKSGTGKGSADYSIQGEFAENGIVNNVSHVRGTISMCRQSGPDTASTQFFILQGSYPEYDGKYAAFGRAMDEESLRVIDSIGNTPVDGNYSPVGTKPPTIRSIRVETFGYNYESAKIKEEKKEK